MHTQKLDDSVLVSKYIAGNERSLEILILRHKQRIFSFIYSKVQDRDVSEDIFQDTFIKVINTLKMGKYNEEGKFLPWVMRIAHNLVIDHFRKGNRMPTFQNTDEFDIFSVLSDNALSAEGKLMVDALHNVRVAQLDTGSAEGACEDNVRAGPYIVPVHFHQGIPVVQRPELGAGSPWHAPLHQFSTRRAVEKDDPSPKNASQLFGLIHPITPVPLLTGSSMQESSCNVIPAAPAFSNSMISL